MTSPFDGKGYPLPLLDEPESIAVGKKKTAVTKVVTVTVIEREVKCQRSFDMPSLLYITGHGFGHFAAPPWLDSQFFLMQWGGVWKI